MEAPAECAEKGGEALAQALAELPMLYGAWIKSERKKMEQLAARRRETAEQLVAEMEVAKKRMVEGLEN
jgi:hypothetical protein